jgi:GalNAc-alpha-(1->4)-GalNAc-alpha-(1->3)-diNAcBac-PP-undecaprenol alpha-1,4-N-acetyl-D-galactosaminyltransferase
VVSERIRRSLEAIGIPSKKIDTLPIRTDPQRFISFPSPNHHEQSFIIVMISRLEPEKRLEDALKAFASARNAIPHARLRIIGEGRERDTIEEEVKKLNIAEVVELPGWSTHLPEELNRASIYLLTSSYEGYSRSVIEAALVKTPIIMTDVGIAGDLIRDGESGFVVPVGDVKKIEQAIQEVYKHPAAATKRAARAYEAVIASLPNEDEYLKRYQASILS